MTTKWLLAVPVAGAVAVGIGAGVGAERRDVVEAPGGDLKTRPGVDGRLKYIEGPFGDRLLMRYDLAGRLVGVADNLGVRERSGLGNSHQAGIAPPGAERRQCGLHDRHQQCQHEAEVSNLDDHGCLGMGA